MPVYEYRYADELNCDHCRDGFAVRQAVGDPPLAICPRCGAAVARVYGAFQVKGGERGNSLEGRAKQSGFQIYRKRGGRYEEQ